MPGDVLRQLIPAESLLATVKRLAVTQHGQSHDIRADVNQCDNLPPPVVGQLFLDQAVGCKRRVRFDINDDRFQTGRFGHRHAILDLFLARCGDQHLDLIRRRRCWPQNLKIEVYFVKRERNVLIRLRFNEHLELFFALAGGDNDFFGNHVRSRQGQRHIAHRGREFLPATTDSVGYRLEGDDVAIGHGIARQSLDGVALHLVPTFRVARQLDHFDRRRTDVEADQSTRFRVEYR